MQDVTVAAISTPIGKGGMAIIRISGESAIDVASRVFFPISGRPLREVSHSTAVYGNIISNGVTLDDGIATLYRAPKSYTGEDVAEISCHGGILNTEKVLQAVFSAGARQAGPGEFTKRAFVNGKMPLTQAKAVIDIINAESNEQLKLAHSHKNGILTKELDEISASLLGILSQCCVLCDYPDEDLTTIGKDEIISITEHAEKRLTRLSESYKTGHAVVQGVQTVIVGKPNVGKSSLLNALLGYERAIVTDIPGTTRDTLEEKVYIGRILLNLCDTAGIRKYDDADTVEKLGIIRSKEKLNAAELILAVFDSSKVLDEEDNSLLSELQSISAPKIAVINKTDMGNMIDKSKLIGCCFSSVINISAAQNKGIKQLADEIERLFFEENIDCSSTPILSSLWQKQAVTQALECVTRAKHAFLMNYSPDIAGLDLERAVSLLKETDGRKVSEGIVHGIFSRFCVGK